ncbi:MAG: hypothetical protein IJJ26_03730 [Victivallales bacterium]|nr:hypothetical protein [Victivallales bacterium]
MTKQLTLSILCSILSAAIADDFEKLCDNAWRIKMKTCWDSKTSLLYGCPPSRVRSSKNCVDGMFHWKEGGGYGAGMSDCALADGTVLSGLVDHYAVTHDELTREDAAKIARGVLNLAKLHGIKGFVARGICADDGRSICSLTSRDQYTHWVHGLWRYVNSPMAEPSLVAEYKIRISEVARFMEERVTPERGWNFGLANGDKDPRGICTMWGPDLGPHEDARLPMIYAAAHLATNDPHWLQMYEKLIDEALDRTLRIDSPQRAKFLVRMPCYSLYQANVSLELLYAFEKDKVRREKIVRAMRAFSQIAAERAEVSLRDPNAKPPYGMCWDGELCLTMLLVPGVPDSKVAAPFLDKTLRREDLSKAGFLKVTHVIPAYWRARVLTIQNHP